VNGFERYTRTIEGKSVDFLPRVPILMRYAAEYIGSNYGEFASDYRVLVEANYRCALDFGIDQLSAISDPYRETQGFGSEITFRRDDVPRSTHPLKDAKDLSKLLSPDPQKSERMQDRIKAIELYRRRFGYEHSVLGWIEGPAAEAADLRDVSPFLIDLLTDESFVCDLMDVCVDAGIDFARAQVEAGADTIGIGDAIASQVSPHTYEKLILPREKRLVMAIKEMGAFVKLHICGNITHLLPGITELSIDIIDIDHMVDMAKVRKVLGDKITITGNIDPAQGVRFGNPKNIRDYTLRAYETVGNPYMANAGCEIPAGSPKENLKALCKPIKYVA
jgi:MtaA/CmuA family methyltransferase